MFLVFWWDYSGFFFAKKTPNKQALDDILRDTHSCCVVLGAFHGSQIDIHIYICIYIYIYIYIYMYIHVYVHMYNIYRAVSKLFTVFPIAIECCRFTGVP